MPSKSTGKNHCCYDEPRSLSSSCPATKMHPAPHPKPSRASWILQHASACNRVPCPALPLLPDAAGPLQHHTPALKSDLAPSCSLANPHAQGHTPQNPAASSQMRAAGGEARPPSPGHLGGGQGALEGGAWRRRRWRRCPEVSWALGAAGAQRRPEYQASPGWEQWTVRSYLTSSRWHQGQGVAHAGVPSARVRHTRMWLPHLRRTQAVRACPDTPCLRACSMKPSSNLRGRTGVGVRSGRGGGCLEGGQVAALAASPAHGHAASRKGMPAADQCACL